jgi:hypothetical protein
MRFWIKNILLLEDQMAIWQIRFALIPNSEELGYHLNNNMLRKYEVNLSWNGYSITNDSIMDLSKVLTPNESWSDDIKLFGSLEHTCVELFYEEDMLDEISIRLDLRNLTLDLLEAIINFIKSNNGLILTHNGSLINPSLNEIIGEIRMSDAYSFLQNPETFLSEIKKNT